MKCSVCGAEIKEGIQFCANCGTKVSNLNVNKESEENNEVSGPFKFCQNCGQKISINAQICPKCGKNVVSEEKNPIIALVLSFVFTGLGQFYNGQPKKAIMFIIAGIISLCLIIFLIGAVLYLIVWAYGLYDAYTTAEALNNGEVLEDKLF